EIQFFFHGENECAESIAIRSLQKNAFKLPHFLRDGLHRFLVQTFGVGKNGKTVTRIGFVRENVDVVVFHNIKISGYAWGIEELLRVLSERGVGGWWMGVFFI